MDILEISIGGGIDLKERLNPYPLRLDPEVMRKLKVVARRNGRSVNKEIEFRMRELVEAFEDKYGPIPPDSDDEELD